MAVSPQIWNLLLEQSSAEKGSGHILSPKQCFLQGSFRLSSQAVCGVSSSTQSSNPYYGLSYSQRVSRTVMENTKKYSGHFVKNNLITMELDFHLYLQQMDKKVALWVLDMKLSSPRQINKSVTGCPSSVNTVSHNRSSRVIFSQRASLCFHSHTVGKRLLTQTKVPCPKLQPWLYSS